MKYLYKISSIVATLALIAGLSFSTSFAQETSDSTNTAKKYTLSGKVVNGQSQAISGAKVTVLSGSSMMASNAKTDKTNKKGKFKIKKVSSGTYTVKVEADGYKTWKQQVKITQDKSLTVTLEPAQQK